MKELDRKAMGLRIRKQRTFLQLTRDELARKIGVSTTFLTDIELGTKGFSVKTLNRLCDTLKMTADAILFEPAATKAGRSAPLLELLSLCPEEFEKYAEELVLLFLLSHESDRTNEKK